MAARILTDGGINWTWFIGGNFNEEEKTCTIAFYDRWHNGEFPNWPAAIRNAPTVGGDMLEDDNRQVYGVRIRKSGTYVDYLVLNPANVFSYHDFSMLADK